MTDLFDHRQVGRAFSRAATHYDEAAALQREVGDRLVESLPYYEDKALGARRQVLCVTHLPQVAAHADQHFRVVKTGDRNAFSSALANVAGGERIDEIARMLAGSEITAKTRAHARELFEQHRRKPVSEV